MSLCGCVSQVKAEQNELKNAISKGKVENLKAVTLFLSLNLVDLLVLSYEFCLTAALPAGGITAEKLFNMMKDQTIAIIVMDARSHRDFEESHIQVPAQTCISVPEEAISPGWEAKLQTWLKFVLTHHVWFIIK